jgi:amino-acid N-acetyltransferase
MLRDIGFEDVQLRRIASDCGEDCSVPSIQQLAVEVTARKPGEATQTLRPAVPADREAIDTLLAETSLPTNGLRTEDIVVALDGTKVIGSVALERFGTTSMLRSLVVAPDHREQGIGRRLVIAALEVARWSGGAEVHLLTEHAQRFFTPFGFEPVSGKVAREAVPDSALVSEQCCTTATAMRLSFEEANLPLLSKPSKKPLPTFENNACC